MLSSRYWLIGVNEGLIEDLVCWYRSRHVCGYCRHIDCGAGPGGGEDVVGDLEDGGEVRLGELVMRYGLLD